MIERIGSFSKRRFASWQPVALLFLLYSTSANSADAPPQGALSDYIKRTALPASNYLLTEQDVRSIAVDINGDGVKDWVFFNNGACGSVSCDYEIYLATKSDHKRYCHAGTVGLSHRRSIEKLRIRELVCTTKEKYFAR